MKTYEWTFVNSDGTRITDLLEDENEPSLGDGKFHNGKHYVVRIVVTNRVATKHPTVTAEEIPTPGAAPNA